MQRRHPWEEQNIAKENAFSHIANQLTISMDIMSSGNAQYMRKILSKCLKQANEENGIHNNALDLIVYEFVV
jgi:hypothetical protein